MQFSILGESRKQSFVVGWVGVLFASNKIIIQDYNLSRRSGVNLLVAAASAGAVLVVHARMNITRAHFMLPALAPARTVRPNTYSASTLASAGCCDDATLLFRKRTKQGRITPATRVMPGFNLQRTATNLPYGGSGMLYSTHTEWGKFRTFLHSLMCGYNFRVN